MEKRRIVLDTNCLVQIIGHMSPTHKVWSSFISGDYILCYSDDVLREYEEILGQLISPQIANIITEIIITSPFAERVDPRYHFGLITADPDDNKFVDCAIIAGAELVVTEDSHFNILKEIDFPRIEVMRLLQFMALL